MSQSLESASLSTAVESGKAIGSAVKNEGKEDGLAELYKLNQVWFRMPPTLSLVSKRTITKCQFQQVGYNAPLSGQVASAIFNTGEFYVSGPTSYLVIQAGIDKSNPALQNIWGTALNGGAPTAGDLAMARDTVRAFLGQGGIMNIIQEILFLSASGTEVDRQLNKGLQLSHVTRNRKSQDWYDTCGELQGYPGGPFASNYDRRGHPGYVEDKSAAAGPGQVSSPYLIPTRGEAYGDNSLQWINRAGALTNTTVSNAFGTGNYAYGGQYDSTNPGVTYLPHIGSVDVSFDPVYSVNYNPSPGVAHYFVVPLCDVLGMFKPYMNALIPSQLLAGGRVEIRFKTMTEALIASGPAFSGQAAGPALYNLNGPAIANARTFLEALQIYNIYFLLDSFQLNEGTLKRLNEAAAGNEGLSMMFDTWDWTQTPAPALTQEAQVSQARSRILRSFCVVRDALMLTHPFANSLASEAAVNKGTTLFTSTYNVNAVANGAQLLVNNYQAQLGSLYFPQQPLQLLEEYVMNSYYMWCKCYTDEPNAVSMTEFTGANGINIFNLGNQVAPIAQSAVNPVLDGHIASVAASGAQNTGRNDRSWTGTYASWCLNWGSATYGFLAERSQLLQMSGLPISNARLLRHRFTFNYAAAGGSGRIIDVFTEYTRVAKVFLGGRVVMRE